MSLDGYSNTEIEFVKTRLGEGAQPSHIVTEFRQLHGGKQLPYVVVSEVKKLFKDEIKESLQARSTTCEDLPLSYSPMRIQLYQWAIAKAMEERGMGSYAVTNEQTGLTTYKEKVDINHAAIAKYLEGLRQEEFLAKKLMFEMLSRGVKSKEITQAGTPVVTIHAGYDDEEDEEVDASKK